MRSFLAYSLLGVLLLAGCHSNQPDAASDSTEQNFKIYTLRGKVVSTNAATGEVTLNHDAIPGFMDAMTMPYKLKDPGILSELHSGDLLTANVLVPRDPNADVLLDQIVVIAQGKPDYRPRRELSRPRARRCGTGFQPAQPGRPADSTGSIQGQSAAHHFHLHALPPARLLSPRNAQFRRGEQANWPATPHSTQRPNCSASASTPSTIRRSGFELTARNISAATPKVLSITWNFAVPQAPVVKQMAQYFDVGLTMRPTAASLIRSPPRSLGPMAKWSAFTPATSGPSIRLQAM